jgi:hypothetical protein
VVSFDAGQNSWEYGEIQETLALRYDLIAHRAGAKRLRNVRQLAGGGWTRRPGSSWCVTLDGQARLARYTLNSETRYLISFEAEKFTAFNTDGALRGGLTGQPWSAEQLEEMHWSISTDDIIVCHKDFMPWKIENLSADTWSGAEFAFADGLDGQRKQPYYRFSETKGISLLPGARTGTGITLEASADFFVSGHVGTRLRWLNHEIEIDTVVDAQNATCTIISRLNPTLRLTVTSSANFLIGQQVEGLTSSVSGICVAKTDATHMDVLVTSGMDFFSTSEDLAGPDAKTTISAVTEITPAASVVWDEQAFSSVRGYPGSVTRHRNRLIFCDHPSVPLGVIMSAINATEDFDLGFENDDDAIFETLGDARSTRVRHCLSAEQLLVFADNGVYYVPETADVPLTAATIQFLTVAPTGISAAAPVLSDQGALFIDAGGNNVAVIAPTGDPRASWELAPLSALAPHLIRTPTEIALTTGNSAENERYALIRNSDGTLAVLFYQPQGKSVGINLWETEGVYHSITSMDGVIFATSERTIGDSTVYMIERFSEGIRLDASSAFFTSTGSPLIGTPDGLALGTPDGLYLATPGTAIPQLVGQSVHVIDGDSYYGEFTVGEDGSLDLPVAIIGEFQAGLNYVPECTNFTPRNEQFASGRKRRISRLWVHVNDSGSYSVDGQRVPSYLIGEDTAAPPPRRTEARQFKFLGRGQEQEKTISGPTPTPLTVLGWSAEVNI